MGIRLVLLGIALLTPGLLLAGCTGSAPAVRPVDFSFHLVVPQLDVRWNLSASPDLARVHGVVERRQRDIADAWLQLVGFDATDRLVSFSAPVRVRWATPGDSESFTITLRPRGGEQRFEVRVQSFEYQEGAPTMG